MSLTVAMEEAYANAPAGEVIIETLELDHVTFEEPARVATGLQEDVDLPTALGQDPVTFRAVQVSVTLPGQGPDGPTPLRVRIDAVSGFLLPYLRAAILSTSPIMVTYRAYTTTDLTQPGDVISGLELRAVDLDVLSAEGTLGFREIELQAFPLRVYDEEFYPALQDD